VRGKSYFLSGDVTRSSAGNTVCFIFAAEHVCAIVLGKDSCNFLLISWKEVLVGYQVWTGEDICYIEIPHL
jgi:hypothetical protein